MRIEQNLTAEQRPHAARGVLEKQPVGPGNCCRWVCSIKEPGRA
jgi:hypothetical protein